MMHTKQFPFMKTAAMILLAFVLASAAGPIGKAGEEDGWEVCLRQLRMVVASLEFIFWDKPQFVLPFLPSLLVGYEYCLRYFAYL
ncbi:MAG: hypothetical protein JW843_08800 [Candidatus Aminicenantes bacterium]|nr:hypothetical protein [Candidatus Aminicenantes bacterium]